MKQSDSLLYIATENASGSKWMPWVGYFDGHKPGNVAILPVLDSENQKFEGQEYLGLYPIADKDSMTSPRMPTCGPLSQSAALRGHIGGYPIQVLARYSYKAFMAQDIEKESGLLLPDSPGPLPITGFFTHNFWGRKFYQCHEEREFPADQSHVALTFSAEQSVTLQY